MLEIKGFFNVGITKMLSLIGSIMSAIIQKQLYKSQARWKHMPMLHLVNLQDFYVEFYINHVVKGQHKYIKLYLVYKSLTDGIDIISVI